MSLHDYSSFCKPGSKEGSEATLDPDPIERAKSKLRYSTTSWMKNTIVSYSFLQANDTHVRGTVEAKRWIVDVLFKADEALSDYSILCPAAFQG